MSHPGQDLLDIEWLAVGVSTLPVHSLPDQKRKRSKGDAEGPKRNRDAKK